MSRLSPLALSVLSVLAEGPAHAYEVYATMRDRRGYRTVRLSPGSLYRAVDAMAEAALIRETGTERRDNRPERTTYEITDLGRQRLAEQVAELISAPVYEYPRFTVGMAEAHHLVPTEVADLLTTRISLLTEELAAIDAGIADVTSRALPQRYWLDLQLTRSITAAERDWCLGMVSALGEGSVAWDEPKDHVCPTTDRDFRPSPLHPRVPPAPRETSDGTPSA